MSVEKQRQNSRNAQERFFLPATDNSHRYQDFLKGKLIVGLLDENFALAQGYLKMSIGYVNFRNLSQSPPIHDPSHLPVYPCGSRLANTSR